MFTMALRIIISIFLYIEVTGARVPLHPSVIAKLDDGVIVKSTSNPDVFVERDGFLYGEQITLPNEIPMNGFYSVSQKKTATDPMVFQRGPYKLELIDYTMADQRLRFNVKYCDERIRAKVRGISYYEVNTASDVWLKVDYGEDMIGERDVSFDESVCTKERIRKKVHFLDQAVEEKVDSQLIIYEIAGFSQVDNQPDLNDIYRFAKKDDDIVKFCGMKNGLCLVQDNTQGQVSIISSQTGLTITKCSGSTISQCKGRQASGEKHWDGKYRDDNAYIVPHYKTDADSSVVKMSGFCTSTFQVQQKECGMDDWYEQQKDPNVWIGRKHQYKLSFDKIDGKWTAQIHGVPGTAEGGLAVEGNKEVLTQCTTWRRNNPFCASRQGINYWSKYDTPIEAVVITPLSS
eukprot:827013_1